MKKLFSLLLIISYISVSILLKAQALYSGQMSLKGSLGENTPFELVLEYYGNGPCIVKGKTIYTRQNGKQSVIPVYGHWDIQTSGAMHLSEVYNNKVCGTFEMILGEDFTEDNYSTGSAVNGYWKLENKVLRFNQVLRKNLGRNNVKEKFLHLFNNQSRYASGIYTYNYEGSNKESPIDVRSFVFIGVPNQMSWSFGLLKKNDPVFIEGEANSKFRRNGAWSAFKVGNAEFDMVLMDDVVLVYQCNPEAVPDGAIPAGYSLEGVYVKEADVVTVKKSRQFVPSDPDAKSTCSIFMAIPCIQDRNVMKYVSDWYRAAFNGIEGESFWKIAENYADNYLREVEDPRNLREDGSYEGYDFHFLETNVSYKNLDDKNIINLTRSGYDHSGGVHGMPFDVTVSMRRSDGKVLEWDFYFSDRTQIKDIVAKAMKEQNEEVTFFDEELELPFLDPYYHDGLLHFVYQPYEAASFGDGMPACDIPVSVLKPYMTYDAQKLFSPK